MKQPKITKHNHRLIKPVAIYCFALATLGVGPNASTRAEMLRDPTRPPTIVFTPQERETIEVGPVLQSVSFASGRRTAIISGQNVKTGSKIGEARVVRINETEVLLQTGEGLQTLKLFPDVEKHSIVKIRHHKP